MSHLENWIFSYLPQPNTGVLSLPAEQWDHGQVFLSWHCWFVGLLAVVYWNQVTQCQSPVDFLKSKDHNRVCYLLKLLYSLELKCSSQKLYIVAIYTCTKVLEGGLVLNVQLGTLNFIKDLLLICWYVLIWQHEYLASPYFGRLTMGILMMYFQIYLASLLMTSQPGEYRI